MSKSLSANHRIDLLVRLVSALVLVTIIGLAVWVMLDRFIDPAPFPSSYWDLRWALIFAAMTIAVGLTFRITRGKILLGLLPLGGLSLFAISSFNTGAGPAYWMLAWLLIIAAGIGSRLLNWIVPRVKLLLLERLTLAVVLGLAAVMFLVMIQGGLHAFQPPVTWAGLVTLTILFVLPRLKSWYRIVVGLGVQGRDAWQHGDLAGWALGLGVAAVLFVGSWLIALAPPMRYDEMVYHLTAPLFYLKIGGIIPYPEGGTIVWPHYAEMLYTIAIQTGGLTLPRLIHLCMGVLSTVLVYCIGRRLLNPRAGALAAILFAATPFIGFEMGTAYIDLFVTAYTTAMAFALVLWMQDNEPRWLLVAGILGGIGVGIKLTAGPMAVGLVMFMLGIILFERRFARTFRWLGAMSGLVVLLALPWLVRDAVWTGDPFFPFGGKFIQEIVGSAPAGEELAGPGTAAEFLRYLRYPVDLVFNSTRYYHESPGGMAGGLPLLAVPLFLFNRKLSPNIKRILAGLLLASAAALGVMLIVNSMLARYAMPIFPWMALSAAANLEFLLGWIDSWKKKRAVLGGLVFIGLFYILSTRLPLIVRLYENLPQRFPLNYVLGRESRADYLSRNFVLYDAYQFIDSQPGDRKRILSIGSEFRLYTQALIDSVYDVQQARRLVTNANDPADLAERMGEIGYDYILINRPEVDFRLWKYAFPVIEETDFLHTYAELVFLQKGIYVYRFDPQGVSLPPAENLLINSSLEELDAPNNFSDWDEYGMVRAESMAHTGKTSMRLAGPVSAEGYGYVFQRVEIPSSQFYTLGYWVYALEQVTFKMQVHWLDENYTFLGEEVYWQNTTATGEWKWYPISTQASETARYAEVFVSLAGDDVAWFDDLCLAQGQYCPNP